MDGRLLRQRKRKAGGYQLLHHRNDAEKATVTVLMGGPSAEREVSLNSGRSVVEALHEKGYEVVESDIGPDQLGILDEVGSGIVFPVLHGAFGEDGQLQAILEARHIRYAGSDAQSSRLAMNKYAAKQRFEQNGLLTAPAVLLRSNQATKLDIDNALQQIGLPCVVKPNEQGSSIGVVIAKSGQEARDAMHDCLTRYGDCLVEQFIQGRELTVGILAGLALPILEVRTDRPFYDYQAKYLDDTTHYDFELGLDPRCQMMLQRQASRAFAVAGCRDFGRVDMILDEQGRSFLLEINTIPGFTGHSLLPKAARQAGISMAQMCEQIVQMTCRRPI